MISPRELAGILGRGLAVLLLISACKSLVLAAVLLLQVDNRYDFRLTLLSGVEGLAFFLIAGLIWRNAAKLVGSNSVGEPFRTYDPTTTLKTIFALIALYVAVLRFTSVAIWFQMRNLPLDSGRALIVRGRDASVESVIVFSIAILAFLILVKPAGSRNVSIGRFISYPRAEPDDDGHPDGG